MSVWYDMLDENKRFFRMSDSYQVSHVDSLLSLLLDDGQDSHFVHVIVVSLRNKLEGKEQLWNMNQVPRNLVISDNNATHKYELFSLSSPQEKSIKNNN